jgi:DNA-binding protein HU-beta
VKNFTSSAEALGRERANPTILMLIAAGLPGIHRGEIPGGTQDFLAKPLTRSHKRPAMNKAELIETIQASLGKDATKRSAEEALDAVLSSIAQGVKKDKKVQIIGFGTFEVKQRAARQGRNPKTGEAMQIAASSSVGFKPSSALKASL